jgi:2-C-methyl-D-erythritol 2,4-cyclodiphosphate synthase
LSDLPNDTPRIGLGWDRHRMEAGRPCVLGGVSIEAPAGPSGHSDGDAVLHALTDAVLGAAGLDDLGTLFPDTDPQWKGADSATFLQAAVHKAQEAGQRIASADLVVVCDRPKIGSHRAKIRERLGELLGLPVSRVNLKGKTTEGGDGEDCLEVTAVVLLVPA